MSKIGKKNIVIPKESSIKIEGANLTITGPKGTKKLTINDKIFSSKLNESEFQLLPLEKKIDKKERPIDVDAALIIAYKSKRLVYLHILAYIPESWKMIDWMKINNGTHFR